MGFSRLRLLLALCVSSVGLVAAGSDASSEAGNSHFPITGLHTGVDAASGSRPPRLPIQVMQQDTKMMHVRLPA